MFIPPQYRLYVVAGVAGFLAMVVFFIVRFFADRTQNRIARRLNGQGDDSDVLVKGRNGNGNGNGNGHHSNGYKNGYSNGNGHGVGYQLDKSFNRMITGSGLNVTPEEALGYTFLAGIVLACLLYFFRPELHMLVLGAVVGMGGVLLGFALVRNRNHNRLQEQLPDAFYLLSRSLRAGLSLDQAIMLVGEQGVKPLANEFQRAGAQIRLGLPVPAALENMANRLQTLDFNAFVSTISLYQKTGGNLPLLIDRLAQQTRDRNQFRGYVRTATAMARLTAIALAGAAPLFLLAYLLFEPEYVRAFLRSQTGLLAIFVALALEIVGGLWLYRLLQIEY